MADDSHVNILKNGVEAWNTWRLKNRYIKPDLEGLRWRGQHSNNLSGINLNTCNLNNSDFSGAIFVSATFQASTLNGTIFRHASMMSVSLEKAQAQGACFDHADLRHSRLSKFAAYQSSFRHAVLSKAYGTELSMIDCDCSDVILRDVTLALSKLTNTDFSKGNLMYADLHSNLMCGSRFVGTSMAFADLTHSRLDRANLNEANLQGANLTYSILSGSTLERSDLARAILVGTDLRSARLNGAWVYGAAVWDTCMHDNTEQRELVITPKNQPDVTVDGLEVAQFVYLILNNNKLRHVIDTITSKVVLILGPFEAKSKRILDALRNRLRNRDYVPVVFDFEKPRTRDLTETISLLAKMARFVIVDLSDPRSTPHELATLVPQLRTVPFVPIIISSQIEYAMFSDLRKQPNMLEVFRYQDQDDLLSRIDEQLIRPAERRAEELTRRRSN